MNSVSTHLYFPSDLYSQLVVLARQRGEPIAKVVRDLVAYGVKKKNLRHSSQNFLARLLAISVKAPKGTPKDMALNHDKYLYDR